MKGGAHVARQLNGRWRANGACSNNQNLFIPQHAGGGNAMTDIVRASAKGR
jgi:hypothetical protein